MQKQLYKELEELIGSTQIKIEEPMKNHTTFRVGGDADFFVTPNTMEQIKSIIGFAKKHEIPYFIMGNGSNLLVADEGYQGIVIQIHRNFNKIERIGNIIKAQAGATLSAIAKEAYMNGLGGFEFASGIPGTLGGAVSMNAGAYGGEMKHVLTEAQVLNQNGEIFTLTKEELELGYRTSIITRNDYIVLTASIELTDCDEELIKEKLDEYSNARRTKQPLEFPSAGSTFKRPEGYFAGKLIQDAGLRGYQVGGAQVSEKHCGFVINTGAATAKDIITLIRDVQRKVKEQFGVSLETEVKMIGNFN